MLNFEKLVQNCEEEIRSGFVGPSMSEVLSMNVNRFPRDFRLAAANLCRRAGSIYQGLRILAPVIRPQVGLPRPEEVAEYSVLLQRTGAVREALTLLESLNPEVVPESLLYRSFCLFGLWRYEDAVPLLKMYVDSNLKPYQKMVGTVNLAAAMIGSGQLAEAELKINEVLIEVRGGQFKRLHGNCLELLAQTSFFQGRIRECQGHLKSAEDFLASMPTHDHFFVSKWKAIAQGTIENDIGPIENMRKEAFDRGDWESVREADRYHLRISYDEDLFKYLIFGTPYDSYRETICKELGRSVDTEVYNYCIGVGGPQIDLVQGRLGGKCVEVLEVLTRDFYRPLSLGTLFAELYPDEFFDVFTSPTRVHQVLRRTRQLCRRNTLPIKVDGSDGGYRLKFLGPIEFKIPLERHNLGGYRLEFERLIRLLRNPSKFKATEARNLLQMPRTTFQRFCHWAEQAKLIERFGRGPSTAYRCKVPEAA